MNFSGPATSRFTDRLRAVFFNAPVPSRVHFDAGAIQRNSFDFDANDLLWLQLLKKFLKHAAFRPSIHSGVDGLGYLCFSHPAICSGDHLLASLSETLFRKRTLSES